MTAIYYQEIEVDDNVTGDSWSVANIDELANLIAVIALGQSEHAARIINGLEDGEPALSHADLFIGARGQMRLRGDTEEKKEVSRYHRDGFLFECISWIVARSCSSANTYMKDPHISSTTQGLDGLMIEMDPTKKAVVKTTIIEDKCTNNPRKKFRTEVMATFSDHHESKRSRELVANAVTLIKECGMNGTEATRAAARVLDNDIRTYRAALTVDSSIKCPTTRSSLFKGYNELAGIMKSQRIGAIFPVQGDLREFFDDIADRVILSLKKFEANDV